MVLLSDVMNRDTEPARLWRYCCMKPSMNSRPRLSGMPEEGQTQRYYFNGPVHTNDFAAIISFWGMWTSKAVTNVQVRKHALSTFVINPLVHIYQKEQIAVRNRLSVRIVNNFVFTIASC
jgi:hypothetical protein